MRRIVWLVAVVCIIPSSLTAQDFPPTVLAAAAEISPDRLHADVEFLADDMLEGRGTGTRGYDLAAEYVANRFAALGLEPGGSDSPGERGAGGARRFFQSIPFRCAVLTESKTSMALTGAAARKKLVQSVDYLISPDPLRTSGSLEAALVFVGYGVTAPEMNHDDFAGIDVRGKVIVAFRGAPPRFPHNERAYYSNSLVKDQMAVEHGAIGTLTILKPSDEARSPWARSVRQSRLPSCRWTDEKGVPANTQPTLEWSGNLSASGAEAIFAGAPMSFSAAAAGAEASRVHSFPLAVGIEARRDSVHRNVTSPNVVGILRGSDPKLQREAIVVSTHLDHLGISEPVDGDPINNGAYDNASGTAMTMEAARAFLRSGAAPKRTVIFLAVTGEEKGLQGSDYFARHPLPGAAAGLEVVGNINLDMVLLLRPVTSVIAFGGEHTSLGPQLTLAAAKVGLSVVPDPSPEEVVFVRSDQFSFVKQGIPAIFPVSNMDGEASKSEVGRWRVEQYHAPSDDMNQAFDWPSGANFTRMAFLAAWLAADSPERPSWNPGDFFGERFGKVK